jgi:hypothetical protein
LSPFLNPYFPSDKDEVASVQLCTRSWYGHPEGQRIEQSYNAQRNRNGDLIPEPWVSGLRCWNLLDAEGLKIGRAYEPTMRVPRWVFVDERGDRELSLNISMEKLQALIVEHRLKGGPE